MAFERSQRLEREQLPLGKQTLVHDDSTTDTGQTITIEKHHKRVVIYLRDGTNTATAVATLPSVAERAGPIHIAVPDAAAGVTLQDKDDSVDWTDLTLDANDDAVVVQSDGQRWRILENAIS
jgi:hypothetical protein